MTILCAYTCKPTCSICVCRCLRVYLFSCLHLNESSFENKKLKKYFKRGENEKN